MTLKHLSICSASALAAALAFSLTADAKTFHVVHPFKDGMDGGTPYGCLTVDSSGNLYGTAIQGGASNNGVIYEIAPNGHLTTLYAFQGGSDGRRPEANVMRDGAGNLFGTTENGGTDDAGTVYEFAANGTESVLHSFTGGSDGDSPESGLIEDASGNLYGTTYVGAQYGDGVAFKLATEGTFTTLHTFTGGSDGGSPEGGLLADANGNLYGTAVVGGKSNDGTVFKIASDGTFSVLYAFAGGTDGANPVGTLIADNSGNLFGVTRGGGRDCDTYGCGTVWKLASDGTETVLYALTGGKDGAEPYQGVVADSAGNLYGSAITGGTKNGFGTAFKVAPNGTFTLLHDFIGPRDGEWANGGVVLDSSGNLFGTTYWSGRGEFGTLYEIRH
jgi:uncharacterized repeat protein (TIGR03803 family)